MVVIGGGKETRATIAQRTIHRVWKNHSIWYIEDIHRVFRRNPDQD